MVRRGLPTITLAFLSVMTVGLFFLPIPYVLLMPGATTDLLQDKLHVSGEKSYKGSGKLMMVSVSATTPSFYVTGLAVIWALLDQRVAALPKSLVYAPGKSEKEVHAQEQTEMKSSQDSARVAAGKLLHLTPAEIEQTSFILKDKNTGGPSGGLAFGLAILAKLSDKDFIRSREIVATGTLDGAGNVGPIGGIDLKLYTAEDAGARIFLVPERNCLEIHHRPPGMKIYAVATLQEAYSVLVDDSAHLRNCA